MHTTSRDRPRRGHWAAALTGWLLVLLATLGVAPGHAAAEIAQVRFVSGPSLTFLVFTVMEKEKLVEKHAAALGLPAPKVTYSRVSNNDAIRDAVLSGAAEIASTGVPSFLPLWARTRGTPNAVLALGAFNALPLVLVTRNPNVKSVADFTDKDRIALPGVLNSTQALLLQMEAERIWGAGHHKKLDHLTISRGHPDALAALLSGTGEITAHFAAPPFDRTALADPRIRRVISSHDVYKGPGTNGISLATEAFAKANPKTLKAIVEALKEGHALLNADRQKAAQTYVEITGDKVGAERAFKILDAPDMVFSATPTGTLQIAQFMFRTGSIKVEPKSWKDMFFPEVHDLPGS
ncbi:MAG: ABC transporter substrate-binding protein [Hyphomicrobiaceae bacterium]|nr:ABC transporter substrate-binding protein [Hyphomicrobiaceae bacterium]